MWVRTWSEVAAWRCPERRAALNVFLNNDDPHFIARTIVTRLKRALTSLALAPPDTAAASPAQ